MRVFLIGFMCSGKSSTGRLLAPLLGLSFIDLDREVEKRTGPLLPYIQREGEAAFRREEAEELARLLDGPPAVIATGGGTPMQDDHLERMKGSGTVVWLDVPMPELLARIAKAGGDRPLLFGLRGAELEARVHELYGPREARYAAAHLRVPAGGAAEEVARRIAEALGAQVR